MGKTGGGNIKLSPHTPDTFIYCPFISLALWSIKQV